MATENRHALLDLEYPAMLLHEEALEANLTTMARYCHDHGVELAPHAKTSLSPQLVRRQRDAGVWGITAATPAQVHGLHRIGVRRILLANVLVEQGSIARIRQLLADDPELEFLCYADSLDGTRQLAASGGSWDVLLEVGYPGGRTGTRSLDQSLAVARAVAAAPNLRLVGVAGFEGLMPFEDVDGFLGAIAEAAIAVQGERLFETEAPIVTAGGSSYFDRVVALLGPAAFTFPVRTVLRSGCYLTHDHGLYRDSSPLEGRATGDPGIQRRLEPAFELLATVLSRPEPGLVIAGFGRRDVPTDDRLPVVLGRYDASGRRHDVDATVTKVNDQHAFLAVPDDLEVAVGETWSFGISHPCGAFDRWREIPLVGPDLSVTGTIATDL